MRVMEELKEVCYDMKDVLADWNVEVQEWEIKEDEAKDVATEKSKLKECFLPVFCFLLNRISNSTMDALITSITSDLTSIISSRVQKEYRLVVGVEEEIDKLKKNFIAIQSVLEDAERRHIKESGVKQWLDELKQVCYDMEDVLADWNAEVHGWEIKEAQAKEGFLPFLCFPSINRCCKQMKPRRLIALGIKDICKRLDQINNNKSSYGFTVYSVPAEENTTFKFRVTTSYVDAPKMKGRHEEKKNLINKLLRPINENNTSEIPIIAIVGEGGIGKTTLAQLAYNNEKVKAHFEKMIWICVSEEFDQLNIAREIIRELDSSSPDINSSQLNLLLETISKLVKDKRILLVLDDVWNDDRAAWEPFKLSLRRGDPQSRVLVTTRKDKVAAVMEKAYELRVGLLSDDDCWLVFRQLAFSGRSEDECRKLEDIGRKIVVEKVKGLPLTANILGGLMQFKRSKKEWEDVLSSNLWELEGVRDKLFTPLLLSYYDLPTAMRRCFTYCAMFPKDTIMLKSNMIRMWMAQGYLGTATSDREMELVGEEYFDNLVGRSFFQNLKVISTYSSDIHKDIQFKMHDIVHDSAQILSGNECLSYNGKETRMGFHFNERVRHLSLFFPSREDLESICSVKSLRSLYIEDDSEIILEVLPKLRCKLKYLRALSLVSKYKIKEISSEIQALKHLRYFNLHGRFNQVWVSKTISKSWSLETLYLISSMTSLVGIEKLIRLRHLCISKDISNRVCLPKGIGRLTSLRTLNYFSVGDEIRGTARLSELQDINQLEGKLCILDLGKVVDVDEAVKANLQSKKRLTCLDLNFSGSEDELINNQFDILEALEGSSELEELRISDYKGCLLPNWIFSSTNLTKLWLFECKWLTLDLVAFARLPSLEKLILSKSTIKKYNLGDEEEERGGTSSMIARFPKLKKLYIGNIQELEESFFAAAEMPQLTSFSILGCPKIEKLPNCILRAPQLKSLVISDCSILRRHYHRSWGSSRNEVSHIRFVKIEKTNRETNRKRVNMLFKVLNLGLMI